MAYADRKDAGRRLAENLLDAGLSDPVVLGLARGGLVVAAEVAQALSAPLDVLVVRKIGHPAQPELGLGAVAEEGVEVLNASLLARTNPPPDLLRAIRTRELAECDRRVREYRGERPPVPLAGRTAVVVDDGLATGYTARAAVGTCRRRHASRVVLAVPVGSADVVAGLAEVADEVVCPYLPEFLSAVGAYFRDFRQISDEEVKAILAAVTRT